MKKSNPDPDPDGINLNLIIVSYWLYWLILLYIILKISKHTLKILWCSYGNIFKVSLSIFQHFMHERVKVKLEKQTSKIPKRYQSITLSKICWLPAKYGVGYCIANTVLKYRNRIAPGYIQEIIKTSLCKYTERSQVALDIYVKNKYRAKNIFSF